MRQVSKVSRAAVRPKVCVHCRKSGATRPRDLCWSCYADVSVRLRYPVRDHPCSARGVGAGFGRRRPADRPCPHPPGSPGKIAELQRRASLEMRLWHPDDA